MKYFLPLSLVLIVLSANVAADKPKSEKESKSKSIVLFNGENLDGWMGREDLWSVENGEIVGKTTDEKPIKANTFLILKDKTPANFELTFQYKIEGGNSGVQYRSKIIDEKEFIVGGYQADIDFTNRYAGILYEERGRGILAERGQSVTLNGEGKKSVKRFGDKEALGNGIHPKKWNEYRIVAKGNKLQHFINEAMTAEVIDNQESKAAKDGVIAFQLHRGPAMVIRFKNIVLRPLK